MNISFRSKHAVSIVACAVVVSFLLIGKSAPVGAGSLTFSGTVLTPTGGVYTDGGGVNLYNQSNGWGSGIDSSGRFEIMGVEPGTYTLDIGVSESSSFANPAQQEVTLTASVTNFQVRVANPALKGVLAKPDGTATNGCVNVRNSTWTINRGSCPGNDGKWKIGALDPGTYILETQPPENSPFVGSEQTVTVTDPSTTLDLGTVKLENPFIVGKVALPNGNPVPWDEDWNKRLHLSVDLWNSDWTINKHSDYDKDSKFKFGKVPAGTYTLHANVWDTELYTGSENVSITVPSGGLDLSASPVKLSTPQLAGIVYRPDGLTPVQNAWVNLHNEDWSQNQGSSTDQFGKYRIGGLPAGTYKFEVNPPQDMSDVVRPDPVDITITSEKQTRNITLSAASKYATGTVKKKDGTPVPCAQVNANKRGGVGWANARTNGAGEYILTLAPGSWNIRVEPDRGFDCPEPDWVFLDAEALVEFASDSSRQAEVVNFTVQKATAVIAGTVRKQDGTPITNGSVNANAVTQDGRGVWSNAQIKGDGTYQLKTVEGTYDLNVWTPDTRLFTRNVQVSVKNNETLFVNFTMSEKLALITGTVTAQDGKPLPNVEINGNLDCGPRGCSAWSNSKTDADGKYALAATEGEWFINFNAGQGVPYVYDGEPIRVYVPTSTSTIPGINIVLTYADVTVKGKIINKKDSKPLSDFNGWAFVAPTTTTADLGYREYGGPVDRGEFTIRVPSKLFREARLGIHAPPNSRFSAAEDQTITLVADATITQDIYVTENDAAIFGRFIDSSGLPLRNCAFRGEVFANTQSGRWYGTQINPDCSYEISLLAGTYHLGYNIDQSAGFLNRPPSDKPLTLRSGERMEKNLNVLAGDAKVTVLVLDPDGKPARAWVWADNHEEIDRLRQQSEKREEHEESFRGPGGTTSPEEVLKYCSKKENEKECREFKLPPGSEGPGGCKDALECTQFCLKHKTECEREFKGEDRDTKNMSVTARERKARIASLKVVKAQAEEELDEEDFFDRMIGSGGETDGQGISVLSLLSGHEYTVNAGLPPESPYMPPKTERVNLKDTKTANVTLRLRTADGKMKGFVTFNGVAVANGWVSCWSEDGNSNGAPVINGTYSMNYTFNSTYHCNANASVGTTFLHSPEQIVVIGKEKSKRVNFTLGKANFQIPPPVSTSFDATQPQVITLADGTTLNIPANALASSGTVTVNANPTINVVSQKTAQVLGYAYNFDAIDANGQVITKFKDNITACFKYSDAQLEAVGVEEGSLVPSYWDPASGTWKQPSNITHDKDNNTVCVTADHFTAYAVVSTSGKGRGQQLQSVKVKERRSITTITVGSGKSAKSFKPFPKHRGKVTVGTLYAKKDGQLIVAAQAGSSSEPTTLKVYDVRGKLKKKLRPWGNAYRSGLTIGVEDLTKDGYDDVIMAPLRERTVSVFDASRRKSYKVDTGASGKVIADPLDLLKTGTKQLVTKSGPHLRVWKFGKRGFRQFSFDQRKLQVTSDSIERVTLQPSIQTVSPKSLKRGKGTTTVTITGENLGKGSRVLLNGTPAKKVTATGEKLLKAKLDRAAVKKGKNTLLIINADGGQVQRVIRAK